MNLSVVTRWLYALTVLGFLIVGCSAEAEWSDIAVSSDWTGSKQLMRSAVPSALQTEAAVNRLQAAAADAQGDVLSVVDMWQRSETELVYRYDSFVVPLELPQSAVIRATVQTPSQPLLVFTLNSEGAVTSVGGIPLLAAGADRVDFELELVSGTSVAGIGYLYEADMDPASQISIAFTEPSLKIKLGTSAVLLPAGVRMYARGADLELTSLGSLLKRGIDTGQSFLAMDYRWEQPTMPARGLPQLDVLRFTADLVGSEQQEMELRLRPGRNSVYLHSGFIGGEVQGLRIPLVNDGFELTGISAVTVSTDPGELEPLPADLGTLYNYPPSAWRFGNFELFRWNLFPHVLYFDFDSYASQSTFFRRLAYFVEKDGYQGQLLTNKELSGRHGYNAHNYNGEGLSSFFNAADQTGFQLSRQEELLRQVVVDAGIIVGNPGEYQPGIGGVLSISQESPFGTGLRNLFLAHEAMHGVFYEARDFADFSWDFWKNRMSQDQREFWQLFMQARNYSPDDSYLMVNEIQAYLLQYPHRNNNWYFNTLVRQRVLDRFPNRLPEVDRFYRENPTFFTDASIEMNRQLYRYTGMIGGDVRDLVRL